ncbi:MAG: class I SAM-dependent methyltransferase [Anaerolineaceae bacterium]|nr:class I SAM-dependent methyltransferase [Anaerolineaceae bacterium]
MTDTQHQVKSDVRHFYDQIGWKMESDGFYQNARYEDLRSVSHEYIHKCHLRVNRHLRPTGRFLLDAGSGPVQYPEYLTYSEGYDYRVCADLSIVALQEARSRVGERGLYVVADVANLPFSDDAFDGAVSLHTIHHVPAEEKRNAYLEIHRVICPGAAAVVVNGWTHPVMMLRWMPVVKLVERIGKRIAIWRGKEAPVSKKNTAAAEPQETQPTGTYIHKMSVETLHEMLDGEVTFDILVWRSVSVRFLRAMIHQATLGKLFLRMLFQLEEQFPRFYGTRGQYPLIVMRKPAKG